MQSIDTSHTDPEPRPANKSEFDAGRVEDFPEGSRKTIELPAGREIALYRVGGEFYAMENFCPHKGAQLSEGILCEHIIECGLHGWQFDVRTGECLTVSETIETFQVFVQDGQIKVLYETA